ncbi:hypothetical protein EUTSA_v10016397mg [Eutrema salsugineum]|uniref:Uncharacterized protein n=1 Tax=Eutrema salsugineum TaxID=72664 RepID=V4M7Z5_EUTSA|nr:uncharacterized protein LOC18026937 [Eutrema salsugineum]XP_024003911.1 uncharacterized protein LOC18026937 [Eutrema salsugineum]ESQ52444.1 hypothetical protein EUTSA_v10016397mg [Eutrema salsugineum]
MVRQQRASKVHEDRYPSCHSRGTSEHRGKDELVKRDMLDPPTYLRRTGDVRGKALRFGVLDWKQFENWKDTNAEGTKGACCSYASSYTGSEAASSLELDLSTGVVKRLELDSKPQAETLNSSLRSQECLVMRMEEKGKLNHQPLSRKQKEEHHASQKKNLVEKEEGNASELSSCISPPCPLIVSRQTNLGSETSSKLLSEAYRTGECQDGRHDVQDECSSPVNVVERNQNLPTVTSKKGRHASPNRRFSFSLSQMGRSFSSKESSSSTSVPALSSASHASAKSGPLTFNDSVYTNHSTRTKPGGHSRTRSGPILKPKTEKNVSLQMASKTSNPTRQPTVEKKQCSSRAHALLQFTMRKGINLFQFVVDNNSNNVLAATMKSSDSSIRSYTLYSVNEVKNKSGNWLGRHRNEEKNHPFAHTIIGQMKTVNSLTSDLATFKSESVLFGVETNDELAAIIQTRNKIQRHSTTTIILPSGVHTLLKDGNAPSPLIERWKSGGVCDCGGWDIGCKLRVLSDDHIKSQSFLSFQLFDDQERDKPAFKMVTHDNELHSVEFGASISPLEAFFISLALSSHQNWCEEEEEAVLIGDGLLKRETSTKYASNPPVSPIGRV